MNLLNNAAKYTDRGGRIELRGAGGEATMPWSSIRDTGIGIPADRLDERVRDVLAGGDRALALARRPGHRPVADAAAGADARRQRQGAQRRAWAAAASSWCACRWRDAPPRRRVPAACRGPAGRDRRRRCASWWPTTTWTPPRPWPRCWSVMGHEVRQVHDGEAAVAGRRRLRPAPACCWTSACPSSTATRPAARIRAPARRRAAARWWPSPAGASRRTCSARSEAGFDRHLVKPVDPQLLGPLMEEVAQRGRAPRVQRS